MRFDPAEHVGRYRAILADPNWRYRQFADKAHGAAAAQYRTAETSEIARIPVLRWARPEGCLLAMWGTWPKLDQLHPLAAAWGWGDGTWVTGYPWVKIVASKLVDAGQTVPKVGIGWWGQHVSEVLGIFRSAPDVRRTPRPAPRVLLALNSEDAPDSDLPRDRVLYHPSGRHSEKPQAIHEWIEEQVEGPYLELFARSERPGWTCWGDELGYWLSERGVERIAPSPAAEMMEV